MLTILIHNAAFSSCLFIDLNFLILAAIAQIFNPIAGPIISVGISSKEAKTGIEINQVVAEAKTRKCST